MDIKTSVDREIFNIHKELSPLLWDDKELIPELLPKFLNIAKAYIKFSGLPENIQIMDITLTGSLSGFNYTKYSDLDIHVVIDYKKFNTNLTLLEDFFSMKRKMWADEYDVKFHQYPIELYVQDAAQYLSGSSPQYSLLTQEWKHEPERPDDSIDETTAIKKSKDLMYAINELEEAADENHGEDYSEILEELGEIKDKIKNMRKSALAETGEFGTGNLVFKILRNSGYLERMTVLKTAITEKLLTINEKDSKN